QTSCGGHISCGPANETGAYSPRDANLSSSPNLRKPRTGRSASAAKGSPAGGETWRTAGNYQFPLARRSHRERRDARGGETGSVQIADEKAGHPRGRKNGANPARP